MTPVVPSNSVPREDAQLIELDQAKFRINRTRFGEISYETLLRGKEKSNVLNKSRGTEI